MSILEIFRRLWRPLKSVPDGTMLYSTFRVLIKRPKSGTALTSVVDASFNTPQDESSEEDAWYTLRG